jgi:hypothetical protein
LGGLLCSLILKAFLDESSIDWRRYPLFLNPFYSLLCVFMPEEKHLFLKYDTFISLAFFVLLGLFSAVFAIRNIRRAIP